MAKSWAGHWAVSFQSHQSETAIEETEREKHGGERQKEELETLQEFRAIVEFEALEKFEQLEALKELQQAAQAQKQSEAQNLAKQAAQAQEQSKDDHDGEPRGHRDHARESWPSSVWKPRLD